MKRIILSVLFVLVFCGATFVLFGCADPSVNDSDLDNNSEYKNEVEEEDEDDSIDTPQEAIEIAEQYIKEKIPPMHPEYNLYGGKIGGWGWNTGNFATPHDNGWLCYMEGSFYFDGGYREFDVQINIDTTRGTVSIYGTPRFE